MTRTTPSSSGRTLADAVAGSAPEAVDSVAAALEDGTLTLGSSSVGLNALRGVDSRTAQGFARAFAALRETEEEAGVALALRTATDLRRQEALNRPLIEVVWTGPDAGGPLVRPTETVLEEMLRGVREAGEILVVGYSLTAGTDSPMLKVIELLGEASKARAAITIVLHKDNEEKNQANLLDAWDVFAVKPRILTWDPPPGGPYTKLHAKVLVVDRLEMLVTSANLTYHGLRENLEVGLRIRGPQAAEVAFRFDHLAAKGVLRSWETP